MGAETMDTSEPLPKRHKHVKESKASFEQGNDRLQHDESDASNHPTEDNSNKKVGFIRIFSAKLRFNISTNVIPEKRHIIITVLGAAFEDFAPKNAKRR